MGYVLLLCVVAPSLRVTHGCPGGIAGKWEEVGYRLDVPEATLDLRWF